MELRPELQARLKNAVNLPSPPGVAQHIIELAQDPDLEITKVAAGVGKDPALASKILRVANSALYARRRKSRNLRQALIVLGLNATLTLALSFSLVKSLRSERSSGLNYPYHWRRGLLAATAARALGDAMRVADGEELFLAALLQDIGMLALDKAVPNLYNDIGELQHDHSALQQHERSELGADHAAVGAWLLETWKIPERLQRAVAASHEIATTPAKNEEGILGQCVALSGELADLWLQEDGERPFLGFSQHAQKALGLNREAVAAVFRQVGDMLPETEGLFEIDIMGANHPDAIQEQAQEILMVRNLQTIQEVATLRDTAESLENRTQQLEEEGRRDPLTGAFNRAYLDTYIAEEFEAAVDQGWPLSIAFADLDNFKNVNDTYGHQVGDQVLKTTAQLLSKATRGSDVVARYGGEEFVVVFPGCDRDIAHAVCERIVQRFQQTRHPVGTSPDIIVTISIGVATQSAQEFENVDEFIRAADQALYAAKTRGRNRVVRYEARPDGQVVQAL